MQDNSVYHDLKVNVYTSFTNHEHGYNPKAPRYAML
jgi:hypothetical protein